MDYKNIRFVYYLGIFTLIVYALLPLIEVIEPFLRPIMEYELINNVPIISLIAIIMAFAAFLAFKYRKIG